MNAISKLKADWDRLSSKFGLDVGVDLGSSNTMIYLKDKGVVVDEPTMVARLKRKRWMGMSAPKMAALMIVAYGSKAKEMRNKEPIQMEVVAPIKNGVINDLEVAEKLVSHFLKFVYEIPGRYPKFLKPRVVAGVPCSVSDVQKRAVRSVFLSAGAREVVLVEDAVLAAIGSGMPMDSNTGLMIVDVGGGKSEVAVVSLGGVIAVRGSKVAGGDFDEAIINYVRMKYGLLIGQNTAEKIKIELGEVSGVDSNKSMIIRGRDLESGLPKSIRINQGEVREALGLVAARIVKLVREVLDETPPELVEDLLKRGIMMIGRESKLAGLEKLIEEGTKITTRVLDDPGQAVIKGCGILIEDRGKLAQIKTINQL